MSYYLKLASCPANCVMLVGKMAEIYCEVRRLNGSFDSFGDGRCGSRSNLLEKEEKKKRGSDKRDTRGSSSKNPPKKITIKKTFENNVQESRFFRSGRKAEEELSETLP